MERKELISSREYWATTLALSLWNNDGGNEANYEYWEKVAEKIVDDDFMKKIIELIDLKYKTHPVGA